MTRGWKIWADRGGTFTDLVARTPGGEIVTRKLLSENPGRYTDAVAQGVRDLLGVEGELPDDAVAELRVGTTVATNALLERKGCPTLFVTTAGFGDVLRIGYQNRPDLFARHIVLPSMLYREVLEVGERVSVTGEVVRPLETDGLAAKLVAARENGCEAAAICFVHGWKFTEHERAVADLARAAGFGQVSCSHEVSPLIKFVSRGDTTVADAYLSPILLAYLNGLKKSLGFSSESKTRIFFMQSNGGLVAASEFRGKDAILSGPAGGVVGMVETGRAAGHDKLIGFDMGGTSTDVTHWNGEFERSLETRIAGVRLRAPMLRIETVAAGGGSLLSFDGSRFRVGPESAGADPGPRCYRRGGPLAVTDCNAALGRIQSDEFPRAFGENGDEPLDARASREGFETLARRIADETGEEMTPEAVAEGFLRIAVENMANAIKKISVQRGYDVTEYALNSFGGAGGQHACRVADALGVEVVQLHPLAGVLSAWGIGRAVLRHLIERQVSRPLTAEVTAELAQVFSTLEDEATAALRAQGASSSLEFQRRVLVRVDGSDTTLTVDFVGADNDGDKKGDAIVNGDINGAAKMDNNGGAVIVNEDKKGGAVIVAGDNNAGNNGDNNGAAVTVAVTDNEGAVIVNEDKKGGTVIVAGDNNGDKNTGKKGGAVNVPVDNEGAVIVAEDIARRFADAHERLFGFVMPDRKLMIEAISLEASETNKEPPPKTTANTKKRGKAAETRIARAYFDGKWRDVTLHRRESLKTGDKLTGPCIVAEATSTTVIEPEWHGEVSDTGDLILRRAKPRAARELISKHADPVMLEIFNNLFMSVAEQMGATLANTAWSVNIKERLDFSCAVFDNEGRLVANAPHLPVHLGSMGESVRAVLDANRAEVRAGRVWMLNAPYGGGTHLPDVTVVAPVFDEGGGRLLFFIAARGHHADIGGKTPGSAPPDSVHIEEEGVVIENFLLVDNGRLRERETLALLASGRWPCRNPRQNLADLRAQVAACETGARELRRMVAHFGRDAVLSYMGHVQENAEESVRRAISRLRDGEFEYALDNGTWIRVAIRVDAAAREAVIDFGGTSEQSASNYNAPLPVCRAAVLYVFRTLVDDEIPLNEGCLKPLRLVVPRRSILRCEYPAAVIAGNTEVSQMVTDALYGALGVLAASQGTMNNFVWGDDEIQNYETICGGTGAGADHDGCDAVHSHMTNTRMTDAEVLEQRFPVRLESFGVRRGSGGVGEFRGGDGVVRRLCFLRGMTVTTLSSHRVIAPHGLNGGGEGLRGRNVVERVGGGEEELEGNDHVEVAAGDIFRMETPGGGAFGKLKRN